MQLQLRTRPAVLISVAALTLAGCGGSDDSDASGSAGSDPAGIVSDPTAETEPTEPAEATTGARATPDEQPTTDAPEWASITDEPSGITFTMPEPTEPQTNSATVGEDSSVSLRNYSTMTDDEIELGFNVIDTPGEDYDFDAGIQGVAGSLGGEVVTQSETEVDGNPAVDVEMTFGEGYIVFFQLVTGEEHIVQALASGPEGERDAVRRTYQQLSDSVAY